LAAGNYNICTLPSSYLNKKGKITNTLLAQTITLGLNLGIKGPGGTLANLELEGGQLVTAKVLGGCGGTEAVLRDCEAGLNEYTYTAMDQKVIDALGGDPTVAGLFKLASDALGNVDNIKGTERGVSIGAIASMADAINKAFDECRVLIGFNIPPCGEAKSGEVNPDIDVLTSGLKAYPNPFSDQLNFEFTAQNDGRALLEVYNILGEKLGVLINQEVDKGAQIRVEYKPLDLAPGIIYYKLTMNGKVQMGRAVFIKTYRPE